MKYLITGTSRGLGKDLTKHFLSNDAVVVGLSRSKSDIEHENLIEIACDLTKPGDIKSAFKQIKEKITSLDVTINCAALGNSNMLLMESPEAMAEAYSVNSIAPLLVIQNAVRLMRKQKFGRVINIGSIHEKIKPKGSVVYTSSKSALATITEVASKELIGYGITVNTLNLGVYNSDMSNNLGEKFISSFLETLPISKMVELDEIVNVINFFTDKKSNGITGQTISMSGVS